MTSNITTNPKGATVAKPKHGCCGGEIEASPDKASSSNPVNQDHSEHGSSTEAAESSSCCGGTSKPIRPI
jgi:hypothetical protein